MENLLEIRNLKVIFVQGNSVISAVDGVDLDIGKDEVVVLAGESGSGKTITALSITKVLPKSAKIVSGSANFNGRDLLQLGEESLLNFGVKK